MSLGRGCGRSPGPAVLLGSGGSLHSQKFLEEPDVNQAIETCNTNCQLIASQAEHLQRMRSRCATSVQLTQQEIRNVEEKLVKLFSRQLVTKWRLPCGTLVPPELQIYPSLRQWLEVVGLSKDVVDGLCSEVSSLEDLLEKDDSELSHLLCKHGSDTWEVGKLTRSVGNLRKYTESQLEGKEDSFTGTLYWDSWEQCGSASSSLSRSSHRAQRSSVSSSEGEGGSGSGVGVDSGVGGLNGGSHTSSSGIGLSQRSSDDSNPSSPPLALLSNLPLPPSPGGMNATHTYSHGGVFQDRRYTPPPTPPIIIKGGKSSDRKFPPTPPPSKKNMLQNAIKQQQQQQQQQMQQQQLQQQPSLGRSTSHESQLSHRLDHEMGNLINMDQLTPRRTRLQSDSGAETVMSSEYVNRSPDGALFYTDFRDGRNHLAADFIEDASKIGLYSSSPLSSKLASPTKVPLFLGENEDTLGGKNTLIVPKMSRLNISGAMGHNVHHRFTTFRFIKPDKCGYCHQKFPLLGGTGLRCKECSFKCHKECEPKIAPSCGLPREFLEVFTEKLKRDTEQQSGKMHSGFSTYKNDSLSKGGISSSQPAINSIPTFHTHDSSSNTSSCNSSTPSSPALIIPQSPAHKSSFSYSDVTIKNLHQQPEIPVDMHPWINYDPKPAPTTPSSLHGNSSVIDSRQSHDSDRTVSTTSGSGSTGTDDSERTVAGRVDSQDSTVSEGEANDSRCTRQNSVSSVSQSLREWDIPYDELDHGEIIGKGRFGTVYSGNWHGQVAIKELHMDYGNDEKTLEAFKAEVSTFRKTRHENLVLFMGACMKPPRLAIVTSLCKGMTLYGHIHILKDKFTMSRTIPIAQQIAQGMGYLHARGIVHKDLKTKNIFLENGKVIITDFGLFNVTRLCCDSRRGEWLSIPPGWLCYLAPEIMRAIRLNPKPDDSLPFTAHSDVYSFGTVWYELLCGEWPHKGLPPEAVIWQVGRGMKPSLAHLQASRDVKEILMSCWSFHAEDRREFSSLLSLLTRLPKKRLARSPSHPVQLSRSAESVF